MKSRINKITRKLNKHINPAEIFPSATVYLKKIDCHTIKVHPFYAPDHLKMMYEWSSLPYASKFWHLDINFKEFKEYYFKITGELKCLVLIFSYNDIPVAQADVYIIAESEIADFVEAGNSDYGFHFLMAPYKRLIPLLGDNCRGLAKNIIITLLEMLFYISDVGKVYVEPDVRNYYSCKLAKETGFKYVKQIDLSYKKASLFLMTKENFCKLHSPPSWIKSNPFK